MKSTFCNNPGKYIKLEDGRMVEIKFTHVACNHHELLTAIEVGIACEKCAKKLGWIW